MAEKPHINLVFIGHVDHGKSTLVGRLLYELGEVPEQVLKKYREEAEKLGKGTFEFAWVMDSLKDERERGLTIDIAHKKFETQKNYFTIIDAPGHRDFVKNMITGTSQADAAVLVVSAKEGVQPQTKEHAFLAKTLGVNQLLVALNKMDAVNYDQDKYNKVKDEVGNLLKSIGYKIDEIDFIPISAYMGDNLKDRSDKMPWYKGPTFLEALDKFKVPEKPIDKPLRLPVQDVYSITGVGTVPVGRVETGVMKPGMKVVFMPANVTGEVKSIEMHHEPLSQAVPGDNVGFNVRGVGKKDIKRGDVVGPVDSPPTVAEEFTAQIVVLQHPSAITVGYTPVVHVHTAQVACQFTELVKKIDPRTGGVIEENPQFLKTGDVAVVKLRPTRLLVIEKAKDFPQLGRFAIRDMGQTVAAGMVIDVVPKKV
ncbi:MAG: translation elongation factor EF-1 subunit alpha [Candidatus Altiarchaeales archaeon]|nr:MAG: translation elongation factor EF-1 subunit alpha [Candidatus Altiarchaeales archaeon]RLI95491.1 MAG: translation elongation factor EF-1 subunit alpha [Candidatus Altiarchaeales archaeon]HDO81937.1 translation elongation factor EF-1 subunit alpha [Candidatus Altiarchaeales archaeon]HEX54586.1 translation elongation factor EF-1 subunit alpha [Candidatus Altiarchaeales archaeon]